MKSNSLGRFRRNRKLKKLALILLALAVGFFTAAESRFAVSRVSGIEQDPPNILPQRAVWGTLSTRQERFWPALWFDRKEYKALIERYYPVALDVSLVGWGKFKITVSPLVPVYKVHWGGKFWYLSADGRLWSSSLPENSLLADHEAERIPLLSWGADRSIPIDISNVSGNVYESSFPLALIGQWYSRIDALGWIPYIKFVQAGMEEGSPVVRLILKAAENTASSEILLPDDVSGWTESALALSQLYGSVAAMPPGTLADCTYKGKILLRNVNADKKENNVAPSESKKTNTKNPGKKNANR